MATKSMGYDHPTYVTRQVESFAALTAGPAAVSSKFIAFTNLQVLSLTATLTTSGGTSTYTAWNGTGTCTAIGAQTFSLIRIFNTNTASLGSAPVLGTATYGPFALSVYNGTATATQTNSTLTGLTCNVALYGTATNGTFTGQIQNGSNTGLSGFPVNQGDQLYVVQGTEATATAAYALEFNVQPLANVTN